MTLCFLQFLASLNFTYSAFISIYSLSITIIIIISIFKIYALQLYIY